MLPKAPLGVLCDISGVLKNSVEGCDKAIDRSLQAFERLQKSEIPFVLCTNESCRSTDSLARNLKDIGYNVTSKDIISPISVIMQVIRDNQHKPYILVNDRVSSEFQQFEQAKPDIVVIGDAEEKFTYEALNETFKMLIDGQRKFYCLGRSKFYSDSGTLKLDIGCFIAGLEYSTQRKAECIGKPNSMFFELAVQKLGLSCSEVVMIGDDIDSDVGGAMNAGCQGLLVKTGKFRQSDSSHPTVKPTQIVADFSEAVDIIIESYRSNNADSSGLQ